MQPAYTEGLTMAIKKAAAAPKKATAAPKSAPATTISTGSTSYKFPENPLFTVDQLKKAAAFAYTGGRNCPATTLQRGGS